MKNLTNLVSQISKVENGFKLANKSNIVGVYNYMTKLNETFAALKLENKKYKKAEFLADVSAELLLNGVELAVKTLQNYNKLVAKNRTLESCLEFDSITDLLADGKKKGKKDDFSAEVELFENSPEVASFLNFLAANNVKESSVSAILKQMTGE